MSISRVHFTFTICFCTAIMPCAGSTVNACLWDIDTLQMERRRFPGALEIITGKFVRHSRAYYVWRIQDRLNDLEGSSRNPAVVDDLAVAYAKLGRYSEGIAILTQVLELHPNRYETLANLGTLHMLAGDMKNGKEWIDRAIAVNANAHFGREIYQSLLAEYWLTARTTPHEVARDFFSLQRKEDLIGFAKFIIAKRIPDYIDYYHYGQKPGNADMVDKELADAQTGVLGMMHFANYDSPILLEALGDLLISWPRREQDALHLAARAYYRVVQLSTDDETYQQFRTVAIRTVEGNADYLNWRHQKQSNDENVSEIDFLVKLSTDLDSELAIGQEFAAQIESDEKQWIESGVDVDAAFAKKYYSSLERTIEAAELQLASEPLDVRLTVNERAFRVLAMCVGFIIGLIALTVVAVKIWKHFRRNRREA